MMFVIDQQNNSPLLNYQHPPPFFHLKKKQKQTKNKQNKQTKKHMNDKSTLYCHYFLVFSTSEKLNHL